tara:strand:+ start:1134 stop:1331 length:198 start_codon:yes stop_codon:yes gene_type:complete
MKTYKFEVVFRNGKSWIGYASTIGSAAILASAWAIENGFDKIIESIVNEHGDTFSCDVYVETQPI